MAESESTIEKAEPEPLPDTVAAEADPSAEAKAELADAELRPTSDDVSEAIAPPQLPETAATLQTLPESAPEATEPEPPPPRASSKAKIRETASGGALGAYEAIARSARLSDIVALTRDVVGEAASARRGGPGFGAKVTTLAEESRLAREDAATPFGNALDVLSRGPEGSAERDLAAALWAHAVAESPRETAEDEDVLAGDVLWLATHTAFDATSLLDRALGDEADGLWEAIAERVRRIDQGKGGALGRGDAIVGAAALASSSAPRAKELATELATRVSDPILRRLLVDAESPSPEIQLEGEIAPAPRGPVATTILALTGILFVVHATRLLARAALAYRQPTVVSLSDAGVKLETRTEMLGRTLRKKQHVIVRSGLVRVVREVRYPRLSFYAGLLALAVGSYVGVRAFADGVRAASPSLLLVGLAIVAAGIAADFVLGSVLPGSRGRCRVAFVPRTGAVVCVGDVDAARADAAIARTLQGR